MGASNLGCVTLQFIYIHFPVLCGPSLSATALSQTTPRRVFQLLAQTAHVCFHSRKRVHTRLSEKNRTQGHTRRNRWRFGWGWYHYPRSVSHGSETLRGRVSERRTLPLLGLAGGALPKNAKSLRDSDALMRVAVPRRRGPAGLHGLFSFLTKLRLVRPIPETSFSSPDAPACAVPAQAAFPLALSRLGAVQGFSVLSLCLTPFLDFEDKKRPLTIRIVRPVNGLIFDVHFLCSVQQTGICRIFTSLLPAPSGRLHKGRTES